MSADDTPMMRQYHEWKRRYPDYLLLFRLGDFYEAFHEDAAIAARTLDIALTSRQKGDGAIPMAGVPHHAVEGYIARLIRAGHKVALCDQVEPAAGRARKLIRREVVRLITPGTVLDPGLLEGRVNNYLAALAPGPDGVGLALVDVTTAEFWVGDASEPDGLLEALVVRRPAEVLVPDSLPESDPLRARLREAGLHVTVRAASAFGARAAAERVRAQFGAAEAEALGRFEVGGHGAALRAAGAVLAYLEETQRQVPGHLTRIQRLDLADHVVLTESAVRTLELVEGQHDRGVRGSLLGAIDRTLTPMGGRLLRQWLLRPLRDPARIAARQAGVDALVGNPAARVRLRAALAGLGDVARLAGRIALGVGTPRELGALRGALRGLPELRALALGLGDSPLREWAERIEDLAPLRERLEAALVEEPPTTVHEGAIIRESYSPALGDLRRETAEARAWIAGLEGRERARTGIATLRVRFNRVFGYGIEVSQAHAARVPPEYVRRQTLTGAERYVTPELREHEARLLGAEERARRLELELFEELRRAAAREADRLLGTAHAVAVLDTLAGLAEVAHAQGYARPVVDDSTVLEIRAGRHPVLEAGPAGAGFVANDLVLDGHEVDCLIITGPNMAGKSTYMRQAALIVLLAQIGSFVPARSARIGVVDRVFTRIGAQDNLAQGQSTFLVEMTETAAILRHATDRSLVLLDEIGRGTSTFDGLAIAWAVAEHLHERCAGAKVLFATHYHELTRLAQELPRIRNVHVAVRESRDDIVFLHTVVPGSTDRSYGIQVARLAGLPHPVVERARALLGVLERASAAPPIDAAPALAAADGPGEAERQALAELARLDLDRLTPLEALNTLAELRRRLRGPV